MKLAIRNILWPTDFSPLSLAAADPARNLARRFDATLHILHVAPILISDNTTAIEIDTCGPARRNLDRLMSTYFDDDQALVREVRVGTPWREICDYARSASIDLIVISTHGFTGLKHALLGSVAERVVQHAAGAVIVVKSSELAAVT